MAGSDRVHGRRRGPPALIEMAEQLAPMGYVALLHEMCYRHGPYEPFSMETAFSDPGERARLGTMIGSVAKEMAASDAGSFIEFLLGRHWRALGELYGATLPA